MDSHLQVVMLPFLFCFQIQSSQTTQILLADGLVYGGAASDTLPVVVGGVGPPVSLGLHKPQDHIFDGDWQSRYLNKEE